MKVDIKGIMEGIKNSLWIKKEVEKVSQSRLSICNTCPEYSINAKLAGKKILRTDAFCMNCSCNMFLKSRALSAQCPLGKWAAEATEEESLQLEETPELKKVLSEYKDKLMNNKIVE